MSVTPAPSAVTISDEQLHACLADLEARLDVSQEQTYRQAWMNFLDGQFESDIFTPPGRRPCPPKIDWPAVTVYDSLFDVNAMLLQQFSGVSNTLAAGGNACLSVRSNYGTAILPSLFGPEIFYTPELPDLQPNCHPLGGDAIDNLLAAGVPNLTGGFGERVFQAAEGFEQIRSQYPKIGECVAHYHPDLQGPIDVLEMLWGSDIFLAFYDVPEKVAAALDLVTDAYIAFMQKWRKIVPPTGDYSVHWGLMMRGQVMLRNDSLMNLSPETYVEFIRTRDQRIFDEFGGGVVHFCGRGDHYIDPMSKMAGLTGINMSQPQYNDMETIYRNTVDKGLFILEFDAATARQDAPRGFHHKLSVKA